MRNTFSWTHVKQGIGQILQRVWDSLGPARTRVQDSWRSLALPNKPIFVAVAMVFLIIFPTQAFPWDALGITASSQAGWYVGAIGIVFALIVLLFLLWRLPKRKAARLTSGLKEQFDIENETRKTWATIVGGIAVLFSLLFAWGNLRVTQDNLHTTQTTAAINQDLTRQGQITDRSTKAIAQLGDKNITVRIGGIYALEQVARISEDEHWPIMEILTAYLRKNCPRLPREALLKAAEAPRPRTYATDIEAVLTVLKRRKSGREKDGQCPSLWPVDRSQANPENEGECLNLRSTNLNHANLQNADLQRAHFASAHLRKAYFSHAKLQRANFYGAKLEGARFIGNTELEGVSFWRADLRGADFSGATLKKADLREADLRGADFSGATLEGANLQEARLERAQNLRPEQLATVKTTYLAEMDESLHDQIQQKHSQLLDAPAVAPPAVPAGKVARINPPQGRAEVDEKISANGEIHPSLRNGHLWLAVKQGDLIWPKDPEVPVTGSKWEVTVYEEGTPPGVEFKLALYLVLDEGHERIRNWLSIGNATGTFPGLRKIPGSLLLDEIELRMTSTDGKPRPDFLDTCAK